MELGFIIKMDSRFCGNDNKKDQKVSLREIPQRGTKIKDSRYARSGVARQNHKPKIKMTNLAIRYSVKWEKL